MKKSKEKSQITISRIIDEIMLFINSRVFYAILLAYTGLVVVINPNNAGAEITEGLGITILIAVLGVFIDLIRTKGFNRSNLPTIIESIIFTILGTLMLLFGKELGSILQLLICIAIIINSIVNILCIYDYKNIRDIYEKRANDKDKKSNMSSAASAVSKAISEDFHDNNKEFVHAASHIKTKSDVTTKAQVTLNIGFIIIALGMILTNFTLGVPIYFVAGIVLILSSIDEFVLIYREYKLKKLRG